MGVADKSFHHLHIRKRVHQKHEPYPAKKRIKRIVDRLVYISVVVLPVINLPQFLRVWISRDASGVSPVSWFGFSVFAMVWATYGYVHREKPILFLNIGLIAIQLLIAIGALLYG